LWCEKHAGDGASVERQAARRGGEDGVRLRRMKEESDDEVRRCRKEGAEVK
jgi:hypothetical protein